MIHSPTELRRALRRKTSRLCFGMQDFGNGKWPCWWVEPGGEPVHATAAEALLHALTPGADALLGGPSQTYRLERPMHQRQRPPSGTPPASKGATHAKGRPSPD